MTTVLALAEGGRAWMCADSRTNVGDRVVDGAARKIMRLPYDGGELLIGLSGNAGMSGPIRADWPAGIAAPPTDHTSLQEWAEEISAVLTQSMIDSAMVDSDGRMESEFLLAAAGRVWTIYHHAAIPHFDGRAAVGSGGPMALAALAVLLAEPIGMPRSAAVSRAVDTAVELDMWSGRPLMIEVLQPGSSGTSV